jgi:hypothetical protein
MGTIVIETEWRDNGDQGRDDERDMDNIKQALIPVTSAFTLILLKVNTDIYTKMYGLAWS